MIDKKLKVSIAYTPFPEETFGVSKDSPEFGRSVGKAIESQWFLKDGANCRFYSRANEFRLRKRYAIGDQPISKYKSFISTDGDMSHLNLDFKPIGFMRRYIDVLVNGIQDRDLHINVYAQDILSAEKKSKYQDELEMDMISKPFLELVQDEFGIDAYSTDPSKVPEDDEELAIHMNMNYKPGIEIATETAINTVFDDNHYDEIKRRAAYDIVTYGMGVAKCEYIESEGIKLSYSDAADVVHSDTDDIYMRDCYYWGEFKMIHINELKKIDPRLTESDLKKLSDYSSSWYNFYPQLYLGPFQKDVVPVLYFNYKTRKDFVKKIKKTKSGGERIIKKDDSFASVKSNELFDVSVSTKDVWYDGVMVIGTDYILKWELSKNMMRPKSEQQHALPNFVGVIPKSYKGVIESPVSRMIPAEDQLQMTHIKLQHVKSKMLPDGVEIDIDSINEINIGLGGKNYDVTEALRMFFQTGSILTRSKTSEGEGQYSKPITAINQSSAQGKIQTLFADYAHHINMMRDVIGLNDASDASTPDPKSLVGTAKLAALNSNIATRHWLDGSVFISKGLAYRSLLRMADIMQHSDAAKEFAMKIGKYNMAHVAELDSMYLYDLGIYIELAPDVEEKQLLESNIQTSLDKERIELEDAIEIRGIRNIKTANEFLKYKRRKRSKEAQEREDVQMQMQAQINQQSQQAAAQAAIDKANAEAEAKIRVENAKGDNLIRVEAATAELKKELMGIEFQYTMQVKGNETQLQFDKINLQEDRKDSRINRQGTQQSELIDQRQKGLPPKDFESTNDNLSDLDLSDFEPR